MAVWWVFQNQSYERSRDGGYIWAPLVDKAGHKKSHWEVLQQVQVGDLIFSCNKRSIVATSTAKSNAYVSPQPHPDDAKDWTGDGRRIDVAYVDIPTPLPVDDLIDLFPLLQSEGGPLQVDGRGKMGYLFEVTPKAALEILNRLDKTIDIDSVINAGQTSNAGHVSTTVARSVNARVGQDKFRDDLMTLWGGRCGLTGVDHKELLIASHTKPWRLSNDKERTDKNNGFLFESRIDKLFDAGLISFDDDGLILFSPHLSESNVLALQIKKDQRIRMELNDSQKEYLKFHREQLFGKLSNK
jgi:putative restriction endonuclease